MKRIVLCGIPRYGNMGDIAIACAEVQFIKDNFSNYEILEILEHDIKEKISEIQKIISQEDIIFMQGGGNMGDEYIDFEKSRRLMVNTFPDNKIIIMPQTIYFSNTERGKEELKKTKQAYNNHKNLTIIAREEVSYKIMKKEFSNANVILAPDIVMYLNKMDNNKKRDGALLAMRNDSEKVLTDEDVKHIENSISKHYKNIIHTDTHIGNKIRITKEIRENMLETKLDEFRKAEIVITDRLHGMIFAAITATPCIAFGNYNHKIKSSFEWLKHLNYIKYVENTEELNVAINEIREQKEVEYNNEFAQKLYKEVLKYV